MTNKLPDLLFNALNCVARINTYDSLNATKFKLEAIDLIPKVVRMRSVVHNRQS